MNVRVKCKSPGMQGFSLQERSGVGQVALRAGTSKEHKGGMVLGTELCPPSSHTGALTSSVVGFGVIKH